MPFALKLLLIALLLVDLKTLISSTACGYLRQSPPNPSQSCKAQSIPPQATFNPRFQPHSYPPASSNAPALPLWDHLEMGGLHMEATLVSAALCWEGGPGSTGEIQGREAAAKGKSSREVQKLWGNRYIVA